MVPDPELNRVEIRKIIKINNNKKRLSNNGVYNNNCSIVRRQHGQVV